MGKTSLTAAQLEGLVMGDLPQTSLVRKNSNPPFLCFHHFSYGMSRLLGEHKEFVLEKLTAKYAIRLQCKVTFHLSSNPDLLFYI